MSIVVGISAHFHNSACCILKDGVVIAAAEEERFTRVKHDPRCPSRAFHYCLTEAGITIKDIQVLGYYEQPFRRLGRQLWQGLALPGDSPQEFSALDPLRPESDIREQLGYDGPIEWVSHHLSHAASAFAYSTFDSAAILTVDAVGEWETTGYRFGHGSAIDEIGKVEFPHSLGLLYSAVTAYLGFLVNDGEYKVMGLAPFGRPSFFKALREVVKIGDAGQFAVDQSLFDLRSTNKLFAGPLVDCFGHPPRRPDEPIVDIHADIAASVQAVLEDVILSLAEWLFRETGSSHLCLAGGVSLNCSATRRLREQGLFRQLFVQPAAGDAGAALGAAALAWQRLDGRHCRPSPLRDLYLGPGCDSREVSRVIDAAGITVTPLVEEELLATVAGLLVEGNVVGWFQGRMEFGPRALGARSILADPRPTMTRERINSAIKNREAFQPFAPAVTEDGAAEFFELRFPSPFMTTTFNVRNPAALQAVTHVDGSARVQTVSPTASPRFYRLLKAFERLSSVPVLLNTSFNLRNEPIVCTPADAFLCFVRSSLDALVIGDYVVRRADLHPELERTVRRHYDIPASSGITHGTYTFF